MRPRNCKCIRWAVRRADGAGKRHQGRQRQGISRITFSRARGHRMLKPAPSFGTSPSQLVIRLCYRSSFHSLDLKNKHAAASVSVFRVRSSSGAAVHDAARTTPRIRPGSVGGPRIRHSLTHSKSKRPGPRRPIRPPAAPNASCKGTALLGSDFRQARLRPPWKSNVTSRAVRGARMAKIQARFGRVEKPPLGLRVGKSPSLLA